MNRQLYQLLLCTLLATAVAGASGCKQIGEQTASVWGSITGSWNEFTGKNGQKKNEDQITLASLQKSAEAEIESMSSSFRNTAVSVVKDGTKQALDEAAGASQDAFQTVSRSTQVTGSNMSEKAVSMEKAARSYFYYYMPDNIPHSEKEAREVMFNTGIFSGMGDWFRRVFSGNKSTAGRLIRERTSVSSGRSGEGSSNRRHSLDGRRRPH